MEHEDQVTNIKHSKLFSDKLSFLLGASAEVRKATVSFFMSVRPSAWYNLTPTGRIFMKFYISFPSENLSGKFEFNP